MGYEYSTKTIRLTEMYTARKVSVFGVILLHIFLHSDWIRSIQSECGKMLTRITLNTDTLYEWYWPPKLHKTKVNPDLSLQLQSIIWYHCLKKSYSNKCINSKYILPATISQDIPLQIDVAQNLLHTISFLIPIKTIMIMLSN